ncbi:hypothetical protein M8J77_020903 [Diaphorina citri]|nr:hypothetical protein M8J77_020903 [Diaphorina citri]
MSFAPVKTTSSTLLKSLIAKELKKDFEVYEEVNGLAEDGAVRRIDIIAIDRSKKKGIIVDPTIRFEIDRNQPEAVDKEKKSIYEPTIPYYKEKYGLQDIEKLCRGILCLMATCWWAGRWQAASLSLS